MNIDLDYGELNDLIKILEANNQEIVESITNINLKMQQIEKNDWISPERKKVEDGFLAYMENSEKKFNDDLNERIAILKFALNNYRQTDEYIESKTK